MSREQSGLLASPAAHGLEKGLILSVLLLSAQACSSGSSGRSSGTGGSGSACPTGDESCACYGNGTCNGTLTCASHVCVDLGVGGTTGSGGALGMGGMVGTGGGVCLPVPAGLVAWWRGNGNANDAIGANNGHFAGAYADGKVDSAFVITSTDYVSVPSADALNLAAVSVEVWFRRDTTLAAYDPIVKKAGEGSASCEGCSPSLMADGYSLEFGETSQVHFYVYTAGAPPSAPPGWHSSPGKVVVDGSWVHAVGVYDGSSQLGLYINGAPVGFSAANGPITASGNPLMFGRDPSNPTTRAFNGLIDEVSLYNRALTATEVQALYAAGGSGKCR